MMRNPNIHWLVLFILFAADVCTDGICPSVCAQDSRLTLSTPGRNYLDTVVHEVGHAVAKNDTHPVTGGDSNPLGIYSRYVPAYLHAIRSTDKPGSPT